MRKPIPFLVAVLAGVLIDLLSKHIIFDWLTGRPNLVLIPNVLQLHLAWNPGAAFSALSGNRWVLVGIAVGILALMTWYYLSVWRSARTALLVAIALLMIGAAGNLYDRVRFEAVRDFIDFMPELPLIGHWAVFNVADICITVGVLLYLVYMIFFDRPAVSGQREPLAAEKNEKSGLVG